LYLDALLIKLKMKKFLQMLGNGISNLEHMHNFISENVFCPYFCVVSMCFCVCLSAMLCCISLVVEIEGDMADCSLSEQGEC